MNETWWRKADELDKDQAAIISLPPTGNHLIVGPPGSGKTNLLLLRASYISRSGQANIVVISFTRMLREFINTGSVNYPFESERVQTLRSWGVSIIRSFGGEIDTEGDFLDVRHRILEGLEAVAAASGGETKLDCILIDEAQDYWPREIDVMRKLSRSFFAVGDDRQRIYAANGALTHLATFCKAAPPLKYHYRNGTAICRFVDGMRNVNEDGMLDDSNYDEAKNPSQVKRLRLPTLGEQALAAASEIENQLLAYPDEWIGVFCYRKVDLQEAYNALMTTSLSAKVHLQLYDNGYQVFDADKPIILLTIHSAKGLEFRTVHILAAEKLSGRAHEHNMAFMAATRAKTSLSIYHSGALPGYIENGLSAAQGGIVAPPALDELFGNAL